MEANRVDLKKHNQSNFNHLQFFRHLAHTLHLTKIIPHFASYHNHTFCMLLLCYHTLQVATIGISLKMNRARATPVSKILIDMWVLSNLVLFNEFQFKNLLMNAFQFEKPVNEFSDEPVWLLQGGLDENAVSGATFYNLGGHWIEWHNFISL